LRCGQWSIRSEQAVAGQILSAPKGEPRAVVYRIDSNNQIGIRERYAGWRTEIACSVENVVVENALDLRASQDMPLATAMEAHMKRSVSQKRQPIA